MHNRNREQCYGLGVPGFDRATGVDDPTPRSQYGDSATDRPTHVAPDERASADTPDPFEADVEWHDTYGWVVTVQSGCPECGNEDVVNAELAIGPQFVAYDTDEEGKPVLGQDDTYRAELVFARCNDCWTVLVDERDREANHE